MPTETLYPTVVVTPSTGGTACSGTVRARTCTEVSNCGDSLVKGTADHKTWTNGTYAEFRTAVTLKAAWRIEAQAAGSRACVNGPTNRGEYRLKYSINNGSSFAYFSGFPKAGLNSAQSATAQVSLTASQDLTKVSVRLNCQAEAAACATGACCYGIDNCSCRIDVESNCSPGGWQGDGTTCAPDPCWEEERCELGE